MPELSPYLLAAVAGAAFLAAFAQGVTGFGSALVAMPLLALALEMHAAAALPFLAAGSLAGWAVHRRIGEDRYRRLLLVALLTAGASLVVAAARG